LVRERKVADVSFFQMQIFVCLFVFFVFGVVEKISTL